MFHVEQKNMKSGIYKITCLGNGKIYIGSSQDVSKRIGTHFKTLRSKTHRNPHMQSAFLLYGETFFSWEKVESCATEILLEREQWWMDKTKCYNREIGFNNTIKANSTSGYKHTDKARIAMSSAKKGKPQCKEMVAKRAAALTGKKRSEHYKDKMSKMRMSEGNPMFGRKWKDEGKAERMAKLLSKPRWNKGLTAKDDPRIIKLGLHKIGVPALNRLHSRLIDLESGQQWEADSLSLLADKCPLSKSSIFRIKAKTANRKLLTKYKIETL
jgi:group I intron endonuclease